jgi:hypothetical protein
LELKKAGSINGAIVGPMTDEDLKVHWHSKHLKMLITTGMTEEEADKEAIVYANNRFLEYRIAVISRNRASRKTYEEWYDGWHSEHLKMLLASGMTEEEAHKEATVYADDQIGAMTRKNMKGPQRPPDILNCKHCLKLYMSERTLNEHLNKDGCHLNGDFSMDLLHTDGRIGMYFPEARKVRIAQFHAKCKIRVWRKVVVRRTKKRKINDIVDRK